MFTQRPHSSSFSGVHNIASYKVIPKGTTIGPLGITLRVQVPNNHILPKIELHAYYPKPKYLIIGSFGPLGTVGSVHMAVAVTGAFPALRLI